MPQKITAQRPTSSRLLTRKIDSREASDSIRRSERRSSRRETISAVEPIRTTPIRISSGVPTVEAPKAWIDSRIPERTRNVPSRAEREGGDDQRDVPDLEHPAALLDHDRVQEGGADQPRHHRRVLDRVPAPVAAPAELGVRPARAEQDPDREEDPGDQREAAGDPDPARVEPARDQRADRRRRTGSRRRRSPNRASAGGSPSPDGAAAASARAPRPAPGRAGRTGWCRRRTASGR